MRSVRWSGRAAFVSVMEAADLRDRHDGTGARRGDRTGDRRVFVQREVSAGLFVITAVEIRQPLKSRRAEHDDMIETFASRRSDEAFDECILPWGTRGRQDVLNPQCRRRVRPSVERVIAIPDNISRRLVPRERFA